MKNEGEPTIIIKDFREPIMYYLKYIGDKVKNCEVCGEMLLVKGKRDKYCKECKRKKELEWKRESINKVRK